MSRIGNKSIVIPNGTTVSIDNNKIIVKGSKGELSSQLMPGISVKIENNSVSVARSNNEKQLKAWHGMTR